MPTTVNIHEAKTQLSRLIERVERGEEVIIARSGRPVVRLVGLGASFRPRENGGWRDRVTIAADFDGVSPQLAAGFSGDQE